MLPDPLESEILHRLDIINFLLLPLQILLEIALILSNNNTLQARQQSVNFSQHNAPLALRKDNQTSHIILKHFLG